MEERKKKVTNKSDDKNIESLVSVSGFRHDNPTSSFVIKHDKKKKRFTIEYGSAIKDSRNIVSDKYNTVFDASIGAICDFIIEEFKKYNAKT